MVNLKHMLDLANGTDVSNRHYFILIKKQNICSRVYRVNKTWVRVLMRTN